MCFTLFMLYSTKNNLRYGAQVLRISPDNEIWHKLLTSVNEFCLIYNIL